MLGVPWQEYAIERHEQTPELGGVSDLRRDLVQQFVAMEAGAEAGYQESLAPTYPTYGPGSISWFSKSRWFRSV